MKILFTVVVFAFVYVVGTGLYFFPVYGHANPVTYNPSPNKVFHSSQSLPDKVTITFTERPEVRASTIKVLNSNNERVDGSDLKMSDSGKTLSVSVDKSKITPGIYTVNWAVLSKDDGHITKGSYVFTFDNKNTQQAQNSKIMSNESSSTGYSKNFTTADNVVLKFNVIPFNVGQNIFTLGVYNTNGTAVENVRNVFLEFNNPEKNLGPIVATMEKAQAGNYSKSGSFISQEGNWQVKITVQRIGEYDINHAFDFKVK
jgi:methionine-rich copper-binding protein CopC